MPNQISLFHLVVSQAQYDVQNQLPIKWLAVTSYAIDKFETVIKN